VTASPTDVVRVEAYGTQGRQGLDFAFEDFTTFAIHNSMTGPSEASFEIGDDTGYDRLSELLKLGARFRVFVNDRLRITGRVELHDVAISASRSMTESFTIRTKLTDAVFSSAPSKVRVSNVSIRDFVLAVYKSVGLTAADFDFRGDFSRDLLTGRSSKGKKSPLPLEPIKEEEAKVQPPESCFSAVDRHLRRHGFMHWDGPDGKIIVGAPDDGQEPMYALRLLKGEDGQYNNVIEAQRTQDVSDAPSELGLFGTGAKAGEPRQKASAIIRNQDLIDAGFTRRAAIVDEAMRSVDFAQRRAAREMSTRRRGLDKITATVDGLAYRDGLDPIPWSPDTVADLYFELIGGAIGAYYLEDVQMTRSADSGDLTRLTFVPKGVWKL
jgi:hypothetical protein